MATVEAPVATEYIETEGDQQPTAPVSRQTPEYTQCASYKEAKNLAAARRRDGMPAYAVFAVALDRWCVRVSAAPDRY